MTPGSIVDVRVLLAVALLPLAVACSSPTDGDKKDGGGRPDSGPIVCSQDSECPADKPVCSGGICSESSGGCTSDAECPSGACNVLTGQCEACADCCSTDAECDSGWTCVQGHCQAPSSPCTTVDDCEVDQVCQNGTCVAWDPNAFCSTSDECPRDHQCNAGNCEGCLSDAFCVQSAHGPKCDTTDDGQGPGVGYCYPECGNGVACPEGFVCDTSKGGLCVPSCSSPADCANGLVCIAGQCAACTTDNQCDATQICSNGVCIENPGCSDAQCQQLGMAHYCDTTTNTCKVGCTQAGCSGSIDDCNPCPQGQTCDAITHQCSGGTCAGCQPACTGGMVCDFVTCQCVTSGGGGNGGAGATCASDADCQQGLICQVPFPGLPGTCAEGCNIDSLCMCADPSKTCVVVGDPTIDMLLCLAGTPGTCQ